MKKKDNGSEAIEIKLTDLVKIFIKRKWWFIGTFIVVFVAASLFAFLRVPQFSLSSTVVVSDITSDYYDGFAQLFPEKTMNLVGISNFSESEEFLSEDLLEEVIGGIDFDIGVGELKDAIFLYPGSWGVLKLTTVYNDAEKTYEINKELLEAYLNKRDYEIEQAYKGLLDAIDNEISSITAEIEDLSSKSGDNDILAGKEIELEYETFYILKENRDILVENKDYFTGRITVSKEPDISNVYGYFNYKKDMIFSFFAAVAIGLIVAFAANYFQSLRKQNN